MVVLRFFSLHDLFQQFCVSPLKELKESRILCWDMFQPYQMVKDLRTNYEVSDPSSVLDGEIDGFILAYLANSSTS